jgi:hypothetical protein
MIWPCYSDTPQSSAISVNGVKAPYEATWLKLTKVGNNYVVYNYLTWDDTKMRTLVMIRIHGNKLNRVIPSDDPNLTYSFDDVEKRDNGVYFFRIGEKHNSFSFQWIDKEKHIAKWTIYYSDGRIQDTYLCIDSLYNTFPIVDEKE